MANLESSFREFPGSPVIRTWSFHCRTFWVRSLVWELRFCYPSGVEKKTKTKQINRKYFQPALMEIRGRPYPLPLCMPTHTCSSGWLACNTKAQETWLMLLAFSYLDTVGETRSSSAGCLHSEPWGAHVDDTAGGKRELGLYKLPALSQATLTVHDLGKPFDLSVSWFILSATRG